MLSVVLWSAFGCEAAPPPKRPDSGRVVILMHGRGADPKDLERLVNELGKAAPKVKFILPPGPLHFGGGLAWYPRSDVATPAEMEQARVAARGVVMKFVEQLRGQGVTDQEIYLGGFSQGASVALDVVLSEEGTKLGGLISLSGGALALDLSRLRRRAPLRAFVSHGTADPVLDFATSQQLAEALEQSHHSVRFVQFDGGHTIAPVVRQELGTFLAAD